MKHAIQSQRVGFTLIEMLVVLAIIMLLMGLLLPAVQRVREAGHRMSCANNLKQIGLALHLYHNDYHRLPPSRMLDRRGTWFVLILPYMEQQSLYSLWDLNRTYYQQPEAARKGLVKSYFCPTRRTPGSGVDFSIDGDIPSDGDSSVTNYSGALGDYAGNMGTTSMDFDGPGCENMTPNGVFEYPRGIRFSDIVDGLSNTLMAGEKHVPLNRFGRGWLDCSIYNGDYPTCSCRAAGWYPGFPVAFPLARSLRDPSPVFGSYHPGLVQFVFCDGHVKALPVTIDLQTLTHLAHRFDGGVVDDF